MHSVARILRIAACSLALLSSATLRASAQSAAPQTAALGAQPEADQPADMIGRGYFQLSMAGGEQRSVRIMVKNSGSEPMTIRSYPVDGVPTTGGGVDYSTFDKPVVGPGTWVTVDNPSVTFAPGESRRLIATVTVPPNATPGDHVAGIAIEDARARPGGTDSQVIINVLYRRAIAVVVTVPGARTATLDVGGVALSQDARGSHAVVQLRNTGNSLLKSTGTLEIGGSQASGPAQTFSVDTLLPSTGVGAVVPLPSLKLSPGTYNAHVVMTAEDGHLLADWNGTAAFAVPGQAEPTAVPAPDVSLAPVGAPAPAAAGATLSDLDAAAISRQATVTNSVGSWLLAILALAFILLRMVSSRVLRATR